GKFGEQLLIVTPGIRPAGWQAGGHKRSSTPRQAVQAGADYLVIGQPIIQAPDPKAAALEIIQEIKS
ncbi:MAG TPA: orotidine-5'-phosphate decarboxylase, partial [Firmicutes bacterium]|nr:orotidine-5'-phosphate decarboxylase [Bacillota bacterium]